MTPSGLWASRCCSRRWTRARGGVATSLAPPRARAGTPPPMRRATCRSGMVTGSEHNDVIIRVCCCGPAFRLHPLRRTDKILCRFFRCPGNASMLRWVFPDHPDLLSRRFAYFARLRACRKERARRYAKLARQNLAAQRYRSKVAKLLRHQCDPALLRPCRASP